MAGSRFKSRQKEWRLVGDLAGKQTRYIQESAMTTWTIGSSIYFEKDGLKETRSHGSAYPGPGPTRTRSSRTRCRPDLKPLEDSRVVSEKPNVGRFNTCQKPKIEVGGARTSSRSTRKGKRRLSKGSRRWTLGVQVQYEADRYSYLV